MLHNFYYLAASFFILAMAFSWGGISLAIPILTRLQILDLPSERSSHSRPMLRGAGWAMGLAFLVLIAVAGLLTETTSIYFHLAAGFGLLFAVSAEDDVRAVTATGRIFTQVLAVLVGMQVLPPGNIFTPLLGDWVPGWLECGVLAIGWIWFINLFNFMDGIDGLAGAETVSLGLSMLLLMAVALPMAADLALLAVILIGLAAGFLIWNWHPAKIFMGDVGSVPLGYALGYLLLAVARHGFVIAALIPALYYVTDATVTLVRRVRRGKKFWEAHREHFYQIAQAGLPRHSQIVWRVLAANAGLAACMVASLSIGAWALLPAGGIVYMLCRHFARQGKATPVDAVKGASA